VVAATEIFQLTEFRGRVAALDHVVPAAVQTRMLLESRKVAERGARWLLRSKRSGPLDENIGRYRPGVDTMIDVLPSLLVGSEKVAYDHLVAQLTSAGVPEADAVRTGEFEELFAGLDCVDLAEEAGVTVEQAAAVRYQLEDRLGLRWLQDHVLALPRDNRWQALARLSLREDLHAQLRRLAAVVLADPSRRPDEPARIQVTRWVATHEPQVSRLALVLSDIRATGTADLATLSVGLREVSQLG
jgi:glutamate dehydrogenase